MDLSHEVGKRFTEDLKQIIQKEIADPEFLPQEDFSNCEMRALAMIRAAETRAIKMMTIAIAKHRIKDHGEDRQNEIDEASIGLEQDDISVAVMSWWNW